MYSESDIDNAVTAGVISPAVAMAYPAWASAA